MLEQRNHAKVWPSHTGLVKDLLPFLVKRINEASGLYQMFGMLCDVIAIRGQVHLSIVITYYAIPLYKHLEYVKQFLYLV